MPKLTKYPRLRVHVRKGQSGQRYVYHYYDMRPEGQPDIPLGRDRAEALERWEELHLKKPRIKDTLEEAFQRWENEKLPDYTNAGTKRTYRQNLRMLRHPDHNLSVATWDGIEMPELLAYLKARKGATQANRELALLSIIWRQATLWGLTRLPWPAAGLEKSRWKNKEGKRRFHVSDALFEAVYADAEPMLRDCMDLSTATGMRLTDCRTIELPPDNILRLEASKTGKEADFDLSLSQVLPELLKRRRALREAQDGIDHSNLLTMPDGSEVTESKLRGAYDRARLRAAYRAYLANDDDFARRIKSMFLRDMRKRAADLADDLEEASALLQHSSQKVTSDHYRTKPAKLRPVR